MNARDDDLPQRVLAICDDALGREGANRDAFLAEACGDDARLRASVDTVLCAVDAAGNFLDEDRAPTGTIQPGDEFAGFQIVEQLGAGGMGAVFLAERTGVDYRQRVAVKLIRGSLVAPELIERFHAERKILAGLNHPYIAGLIDGGMTRDGVPYLVMEYVDGVPIDQYCDSRRLSIDARIELVRKVAMAVQSAHQNLVVHRDLKPSNVLVTADGIPKLLDFGIAKLVPGEGEVDRGNTTMFGHQAMTPNYASPEQIVEGRVTTASDVYTLGVLTFELLTGSRPYQLDTSNYRALLDTVEGLTVPRPSSRVLADGEHADMARDVAVRRSTTPSRLARRLSGDLDTILLKALHRAPERRYDSVAAFSDDLGRFVAGQPVLARADSIGYRVRRFAGRHKIGVAMAVGALVLLVGALGVTSWAYFRAEVARADATARFDQVRSLARTLMFDIYDQLEKVPGTATARETIASTAQAYLETLAATPGASPAVELETAQGFARLSKVYDRQAVADPESRRIADDASRRALAMFEGLATRHPQPGAVYRALGSLRSNRADSLLYNDNKAAEAREETRLALASFEQAESLAPGDIDLIVERLTAQQRFADSYKWENDYARAAGTLVPLLDEVAAASTAHGDDPRLDKKHADIRFLYGEVLYFDEQPAAAVEQYETALSLYRRTLDATGPDHRIGNALFIALWSLGNAQNDLELREAALANYAEALEIVELQLARDPDDRASARRRAILMGSTATVLAGTGRVDEGLMMMNDVNAWFEAQRERDPETPGAHRSVAVSYHVTGDLLANAGRAREACDWYRRTLEIWQDIDARFGLSEFDAGQPERLAKLLSDC